MIAALRLLFAVAVIWTGVGALLLATAHDGDQPTCLAGLALVWSGTWLIEREG